MPKIRLAMRVSALPQLLPRPQSWMRRRVSAPHCVLAQRCGLAQRPVSAQRCVLALCLGLALSAQLGCQSNAPAAQSAPQAAPEPVAAEPAYVLRALNEHEESFVPGLTRHMDYLSGKLGERPAGDAWAMADSADYFARQYEELGLAVQRQGFELEGSPVQNILVALPGSASAGESIVVSAHYDSPPGEKNAGAASCSILLELVRSLQHQRRARTILFASLAVGESDFYEGQERGSVLLKRELVENQGRPPVLSVHLDHLASFSQQARPRVRQGEPSLLLQRSSGTTTAYESFALSFALSPFLLIEENFSQASGSDAQTIASAGIPSIWLQGDKPSQSAEIAEMALFTATLEAALLKLANPGG